MNNPPYKDLRPTAQPTRRGLTIITKSYKVIKVVYQKYTKASARVFSAHLEASSGPRAEGALTNNQRRRGSETYSLKTRLRIWSLYLLGYPRVSCIFILLYYRIWQLGVYAHTRMYKVWRTTIVAMPSLVIDDFMSKTVYGVPYTVLFF